MRYTSSYLAELILRKLKSKQIDIISSYQKSVGDIGYFYIDNLLPKEIVNKIHDNFPSTEESMRKKSLREYKYVAFEINKYDPILDSITYAFQDDRILDFFRRTLNIDSLYADVNLYAGGLSMMEKGNFLNPHLFAGLIDYHHFQLLDLLEIPL